MRKPILLALFALFLPRPTGAGTAAATIRVDAGRVLNRVSPWMYGSCIEDVNHEIYGGLYSQMIFGESFEEPPPSPGIRGWERYGGQWRVEGGTLPVAADAGAKLVRKGPESGDAVVEVEVRLDDDRGDNAGLILRVQNPRTGADTWTGYEVSLSALHHALILGRHRENWEPIRQVPAAVEPGRWHRLRVVLTGPELRVFLDGGEQPLLSYRDATAPLPAGRIGLRTWNSNASFRNLKIETTGEPVRETFVAEPGPDYGSLSGMWDPVRTGSARARLTWSSERPFNTSHCQEIALTGGSGVAGVANRGLNRWGMAVREGHSYRGRLYLSSSDVESVTVALQSADGSRTYARRRLRGVRAEWSRHDFALRSRATDPNARFALWIDRPGRVRVDQVFLSPSGSDLFHGLPVRADLAKGLVDEGLTFVRYGGSMVNAPEYRWKKMLGDPDRRPQYRGWWYPHSTNGFGIEEFLRFCEAARFEPVFAINIEETPEDAADLVEYLNGPASSEWGRRRARNGRPKPYRLRYLEIGNEEAIDGSAAWYARYLERFKLLSKAIHARDPALQLIIAAWWRPEETLVRRIVQETNGEAALWDVHVGGDDLREGANADRLFTRMEALLQEWAPGTKLKAAVLEENGGRHDLQRALGHALILNATQRHGEFARMDCPANCLQPWRQNDNGWDQGQLFFTPSRVWGMPPYYAQQMLAAGAQPLRVSCECKCPDDTLDAVSLRSEDGKTLILRVVNSGAAPVAARLAFFGKPFTKNEVRVTELSGALDAVNSPEEPRRCAPVERTWVPFFQHLDTPSTFPPHSLTVMRFE